MATLKTLLKAEKSKEHEKLKIFNQNIITMAEQRLQSGHKQNNNIR